MESMICKHWRHCPSEEVTTLLNTDADKGLLSFEAGHRLEKYGSNSVTVEKQKRPLMRSLLQFHQALKSIIVN